MRHLYSIDAIFKDCNVDTTLLEQLEPENTYSKKDLFELAYRTILQHNPTLEDEGYKNRILKPAMPLWIQNQTQHGPLQTRIINGEEHYQLTSARQRRQ